MGPYPFSLQESLHHSLSSIGIISIDMIIKLAYLFKYKNLKSLIHKTTNPTCNIMKQHWKKNPTFKPQCMKTPNLGFQFWPPIGVWPWLKSQIWDSAKPQTSFLSIGHHPILEIGIRHQGLTSKTLFIIILPTIRRTAACWSNGFKKPFLSSYYQQSHYQNQMNFLM